MEAPSIIFDLDGEVHKVTVFDNKLTVEFKSGVEIDV